jgi:putative FmdB family regulatory protein
MPIYEFQCKKCGQRSEQLCKMGETGKDIVCPRCGERTLERVISGFACPGIKGGQDGCSGCKGGSCSGCH